MNPILNILGYVGFIIFLICLFYSAAQFIIHLSERSKEKNSKFLDFIHFHSYGCTIILFFILIIFSSLAIATIMQDSDYDSLEAERAQLSDERSEYYNSGYEKGYEEGYDEGYLEGYSYGEADGYDEGYEDGYDTGYTNACYDNGWQ